MKTPALPSPAATLVLLRDRAGGGVETLLVRRHARSRFAAGDHVFPGGKIEADDMPADAERFCLGVSGSDAAARLRGDLSPREALGYLVGAIREAFEEVGVLLACRPHGRFVSFTAESRERYASYRAACQRDNAAFFDCLRAESLKLATDRLAYFSHWITPEESPIRFDTRFFAAVAPEGQEAVADGEEVVDARWLTPAEALQARERKEISLRFPTIKNLELLAGANRASELVAALGQREVPTIRPRVLVVDGRPQPVIPPDPRWY